MAMDHGSYQYKPVAYKTTVQFQPRTRAVLCSVRPVSCRPSLQDCACMYVYIAQGF